MSTDPARMVRVDSRTMSESLGPLAWLLWSVFIRSRNPQYTVRYRLQTLQTKVPAWLAKRRWGKPENNTPPSIRTISRALKRLEEFGLVVRTGRTYRGCAIRTVRGHLAPGDASGMLVPVGAARLAGAEVAESMIDTDPSLEPAPKAYADAKPHPHYGRLLLKKRDDLIYPDIPTVLASELDYTPPPYPLLKKTDAPIGVVQQLVAAYQAMVNYHTHNSCELYTHSMSRGENVCLQGAAKKLRKLELPPHKWALYWSRILMNAGDSPWIPVEEKPPKISSFFNPNVLRKHGEAAQAVEMVLPWVRAPEAFTLETLLEKAQERAELAMHFERITQGDLDRLGRSVTMESDKLRSVVKQWNNARYAEDNHRIRSGGWVWA